MSIALLQSGGGGGHLPAPPSQRAQALQRAVRPAPFSQRLEAALEATAARSPLLAAGIERDWFLDVRVAYGCHRIRRSERIDNGAWSRPLPLWCVAEGVGGYYHARSDRLGHWCDYVLNLPTLEEAIMLVEAEIVARQ